MLKRGIQDEPRELDVAGMAGAELKALESYRGGVMASKAIAGTSCDTRRIVR
jgi:hypothetical protein